MAGLPNFALQLAKSFSETPRAREQAPQKNTGMCLATIFSRNSLSGGQPMGITASDVPYASDRWRQHSGISELSDLRPTTRARVRTQMRLGSDVYGSWSQMAVFEMKSVTEHDCLVER